MTPVAGWASRPRCRLRSEKSHQEAGGRGFDSRHLHARMHAARNVQRVQGVDIRDGGSAPSNENLSR
jgi:hypothetical protein